MIMRLSCLREQGGFTVGSITEDSDTSLALHSRGYKSIYIDQVRTCKPACLLACLSEPWL